MALHIPEEFMPPTSPSAIISKNGRYYPLEEPAPQKSASPPPPSLRDFFDVLRRRKAIAINTFLLVVVLGIVLTLMTKPIWSTSAKLLVEGRANTLAINNSDDPLSSVFQPKVGFEVDTQIELLRSSLVLRDVYKESKVQPKSVNLAVKRVAQTNVIDITVTSNSREAAERFATALPKVYERQTRESRLREVAAALDFAQKSLRDQNDKLTRTEKAFEQFKSQKGVVNASVEVNTAIEAAAENRRQLVQAQSQINGLSGQLSSLTSERAGISPFIDTSITTTNPALEQLRNQIADLRSERQRLSFLYKPSDDRIRQIDIQISDMNARLSRTAPTVTTVSRSPNPAIASLDAKIADTRTALESARKAVGPLRERVQSQARYLNSFNEIQRQEAQLQRDLESSSGASKTLADSVLQLTLRKKALEAAGAPVTIMETAGPATQIAPRLDRGIILAMLLGALLACVAALIQDSLDDHLHNENEARQMLDTPILGYFPMIGNQRGRPILNLEDPDRNLLESFRVLRSNVQFTLVNRAQKGNLGHRLLITSSVPAEGKSYVASNLAIAMALDGRRVIIVDADLYRPRMHEVFDLNRHPGLTDVLVGSVNLQDALQEVGIPNLRVLAAGISAPNPAELLNAVAMNGVIEKLSLEADIVIFDSPPMLATADSQVLSAKVDGVIYVMQLGRVPRSAVGRALELLRQANANLVGVVFNKVETPQNGKGYAGYYYYDYSHEKDGEEGVPLSASEKVIGSVMAGVQKVAKPRLLSSSDGSNDGDDAHIGNNGHPKDEGKSS